MLMNMSVQPVVAELHTVGDKQRLQNALRGTATLAGIPAFVILCVFIFFGAPVLELVYGEHYRDAATILAILSVGQMVNAWSGSCGLVLAFTGHQKQLMYITILTSILSVLLAIGGALYLGLFGIAAGVAAGRIIQNLSSWLLVRKFTGYWTHALTNPSVVMAAASRLIL